MTREYLSATALDEDTGLTHLIHFFGAEDLAGQWFWEPSRWYPLCCEFQEGDSVKYFTLVAQLELPLLFPPTCTECIERLDHTDLIEEIPLFVEDGTLL